jgi:hypothetical protein
VVALLYEDGDGDRCATDVARSDDSRWQAFGSTNVT